MAIDTPNPSVDGDLPRPPAGRRAASRPAGPPAPLPVFTSAPDASPDASGQAMPEPVFAPEPARTPRKRAARKTAVATEAAEPSAESEAPARVARKRATRKNPAPKSQVSAPSLEPSSTVEEVTTGTFTERDAVLAELAVAIASGAVPELPQAEAQLAQPVRDSDGTELTTQAGEVAEEQTPSSDAEPAENSPGKAENDAEGIGSRRRRRRGGRRRRRGGVDRERDEDHDAENSEPGEETIEQSEGAEHPIPRDRRGVRTEPESDDSDDVEESDGTRRRRRRRRRRGEDTSIDDADVDVVVRVREPRRREHSASDEVTGIEGSTRMEAKRLRRRDGRTQSRRRTPILSESEFLSRRESVKRTMAIRQSAEYTQIAVLEDGVLVEHYVDRASATSLIGNIYLGRVQNVLPSMEAAFIDIGRGRNAVLYAGEVDWDSFGAEGGQRRMEAVFKSGQPVLVQVTKDPVGAKGARLTNHISLPGRYIVYSPDGQFSGISRKLPDTERQRLREILSGLIDHDSSVIVRTAAEGVGEAELVRDVNRLTAQWEAIEKKTKQGSAPQLLYAEPDATVRIVRDLFTEDFSQLVIDGNGSAEDAYDMVEAYVSHVAPHLVDRLERWDSTRGDVFAKYRVDEQIAKALERKVFLPSGGSLIIDRTEAMTVIDVNTGRFTGTSGNLEATVTSNNLEAAEEIVRQLRLRDIGGIIVIDFIDMVLPSNRELLLRRLVECLGRDRTRHQVTEVTSLGLVQMTRKKIGTGLAEAFTEQCPECKGRGYHVHDTPVATQALADGGERSGKRGPSGKKTVRSSRRQDAHAHVEHEVEPQTAPELKPSPELPAQDAAPSTRSRRERRGGRRDETGELTVKASTDETTEEAATHLEKPPAAAEPAPKRTARVKISETTQKSVGRASKDKAVAEQPVTEPLNTRVRTVEEAAVVDGANLVDVPVEEPLAGNVEPTTEPHPQPKPVVREKRTRRSRKVVAPEPQADAE